MSSNFFFSNKSQQNLGNIDFTKIKSGLKKEDIQGSNQFVKSLFDMLDTNSDEVLNRNEIINLQNLFNEIDKDDNNEITEKEVKRIKLANGKNLGTKNVEAFIELISKIVQKSESEGVVNVTESEVASEIITYNDGRIERRLNDGTVQIISQNGNEEKSQIYDENGNIALESAFSENSEMVTTYNENGDAITTKINSEGGYSITQGDTTTNYQNGITTITVDGKITEKRFNPGNRIIYNENGTKTSEIINENSKTSILFDTNNDIISEMIITYNNDGSKNIEEIYYDLEGNQIITYRNLFRNSNIVTEEKYIGIDGKEITLTYDKVGNTSGVIVQNGETIDMIAKAFGVNKEELIRLNQSKVKGQGNNRYFETGENITIPGKINANSNAIKFRNSAEEEIAEKEFDLFIKEQNRINREWQESLRNQEARLNKRAKAITQAQSIKEEFCEYGITPGTIGGYRVNDTGRRILNNIDKSNIIEFYEAFTLPNTVVNYIGTDSTYIDTHFEMLKQIAQEVGVPDDLIRSYVNGLKNARSGATTAVSTVNDILYKFISLINSYKFYLGTNEIEALKNMDLEQMRAAQQQVVDIYSSWIENAEKAFEAQLKADGICADIADGISIIWGSENRADVIREELAIAKRELKALRNCQTAEEFSAKYLEIFGVEFDFPLFIATIRKQQAIEQATPIIEELDTEISFLEKYVGEQPTGSELHDYYGGAHTAYYPTLEMRLGDYLAYKDGCNPDRNYANEGRDERKIYSYVSPQNYERDLNEAIEYLGGRDAVLSATKQYYMNNFNCTEAEVRNFSFENSIYQIVDYIQHELETRYAEKTNERNQILAGMSVEEAQRDISNTITGMFGTNDSIMVRVMEYNQSQQVGGELVKGLVVAGGAVVATLCQCPWLAMGIATFGTAGVELIDSASTKYALNELKVGNLEGFAEKTWEQYDLKTVVTNTIINLVSMGAGSAVTKFASSAVKSMMISSKLVSKMAEVLIQVQGDLLVGIATDYVVHGEVTIQGVIYNVAFSIVGNTISLVAAKPKKQNFTVDDYIVSKLKNNSISNIDIKNAQVKVVEVVEGNSKTRNIEITSSNNEKIIITEPNKKEIEKIISTLYVKEEKLSELDSILIENYIKNIDSLENLNSIENSLRHLYANISEQAKFTELIDSKRAALDLNIGPDTIEINIENLRQWSLNTKSKAVTLISADEHAKYGINNYEDFVNSSFLTNEEKIMIERIYTNAEKQGYKEFLDSNIDILIGFAGSCKDIDGKLISIYENLSAEQLSIIKYAKDQLNNGLIDTKYMIAIDNRIDMSTPIEIFEYFNCPEKLPDRVYSKKIKDLYWTKENCLKELENVKLLKEFLNTQSIPNDITVYRVQDYSIFKDIKIGDSNLADIMQNAVQNGTVDEVIKMLNSGDTTITHNNHIGTSLTPHSIFSYEYPVRWEIDVPKASKGAFLESMVPKGACYSEAEFLIQMGSKFKIKEVSYSNGTWNIKADLVQDSTMGQPKKKQPETTQILDGSNSQQVSNKPNLPNKETQSYWDKMTKMLNSKFGLDQEFKNNITEENAEILPYLLLHQIKHCDKDSYKYLYTLFIKSVNKDNVDLAKQFLTELKLYKYFDFEQSCLFLRYKVTPENKGYINKMLNNRQDLLMKYIAENQSNSIFSVRGQNVQLMEALLDVKNISYENLNIIAKITSPDLYISDYNQKIVIKESLEQMPANIKRICLEHGFDLDTILANIIENKPIVITTKEQRQRLFGDVIANNSKYNQVLSNYDFNSFGQNGIPLKYSREDLINNLQEIIKNLPDAEKILILSHFGLDVNFNGLINNKPFVNKNASPETIKSAQKFQTEINKFLFENEIEIDNPEMKNFLESLFQSLPEFAYTIGKQNGNSNVSLDTHILMNLQNLVKDSSYMKLSDESKTIVKLVTILQDLSSSSGSNGVHPKMPALEANAILDEYNLSNTLKNRVIDIIDNYHLIKKYNSNNISAEVVASKIRHPEELEIYKLLAKNDFLNDTSFDIKTDIDLFLDDLLLPVKNKIDIMHSSMPLIFDTLNISKFPLESFVLDQKTIEIPVLDISKISARESLERYGFAPGVTIENAKLNIHMTDDLEATYSLLNGQERFLRNYPIISSSLVSILNADGRGKYGFALKTDKYNIIETSPLNIVSGYKKDINTDYKKLFSEGAIGVTRYGCGIPRDFLKKVFIDNLYKKTGIKITEEEYLYITEKIAHKKHLTQITGDLLLENGTINADDLVLVLEQTNSDLIKYAEIDGDNTEITQVNAEISAIVAKVESIDSLEPSVIEFAHKNNLGIIILPKDK